MRKIFYGVYLRRVEVSTALDLIRFLGEPGSVRFSHITLRGPYRRNLTKSRMAEINSDPHYKWEIALTEPVAFFEGTQSTVAIAVDLMSLNGLLYKPDFPQGTPHITLYDGPDRTFARQLFALVGQHKWHNVLGVTTLRRIEPKRNMAHEFPSFFAGFTDLYEKVVGAPEGMPAATGMSAYQRLDLIDEIIRGCRPQSEAPPANQIVPIVQRSVWA